MDANNFFPEEDYKIPTTSNYMRLTEGSHKLRVLGPADKPAAVLGYVYFNTDKKAIRSKEAWETRPADIKGDDSVKHFWAFACWSYEDSRIQILEITQKSIMAQMKAYIDNPDWGDPKSYDITINRKGTTKNDTEYTVMPSPHKPIEPEIVEAYRNSDLDLQKLFTGEDPFVGKP